MSRVTSLYAKYGRIIAARDGNGFTCSYCGAALIPPGVALTNTDYYSMHGVCLPGKVQGTIDHIIPRSAGGANDPANFTLACRRCNASKKNHELNIWRAVRE